MTVAILVQSDAGDVADANAYIDVAAFKAYHALRGNDITGRTDDQIATDIIKGTDYAEVTFRWAGSKLTTTQSTQWPRKHVRDRDGQQVTGIPKALKNAVAEYALRARSAPLAQDTVAPVGGHILKQTTDKVDVLETTVIYDNTPGLVVVPAYPAADGWLRAAGLIATGMRTLR